MNAPARKPRRVKATFMGPFAIGLAFVMAVFVAALYLLQIHIRDRDLAERGAAVSKLFEQKLQKDTNLMSAVLHAMKGNAAVARAFRDADRAALTEAAGPLFQTLHTNHRITHLYFHSPYLINLLRLHSPHEYGDAIMRGTSVRAHERRETVRGLELGPLGTLTLRLVTPWEHNGQLLGFLEIGQEIEHVLHEIRNSLSVDLLLLVDKRLLKPEQWRRGLALKGREGDWERFGPYAALAQTAKDVPAALTPAVLEQLRSGRPAEFRDGGSALHVALLPLEDGNGGRIGDLVVLRDITVLQGTFGWSVFVVTLLCLATGSAVLGVFYIALERVERDYRRQHDLERQLLRLNTEHQRILQVEKLSALGTMVGGIAHQLNNPLVGVVNMAQLADREADDPARTRELLKEIRRAGEDCRAYIQRMLQFSKVSCFEAKPTPMGPLIDDTVLLFRQTERRHLPVEIKLPPEPVVLSIDPILMRHALFNLLLNAAQATPGEGTITIALERAADPDSGAPGWALSVTDQGTGIAPEVVDRIFTPFFTTRSDGTGLGLPVVQHVALLHDGQVSATNQPGAGARFAIWLPEPA